MENDPQGGYTKGFQEETAKMVTEQGLSIPEADRRLSTPKSAITNWVRSMKGGILVKSKNRLLERKWNEAGETTDEESGIYNTGKGNTEKNICKNLTGQH